MGYRSKGLWLIKGPTKHIIAAWTKCRLTLTAPTDSREDLYGFFKLFRVGRQGYIRLSYEGWKWYDDYPDVKFLNSVWDCLEEYAATAMPDEDGRSVISGRRLCIGEDYDGARDESFGDDVPDIYISRLINSHEPNLGEPFILSNTEPT